MIETVAVFMIIAIIFTFMILLPLLLFFNKKRKVELHILLRKCDPLNQNKLKDFINDKLKNEKFIKKIFNESFYSFQPYISQFIENSINNGIVSPKDLLLYKKNNKAVRWLLNLALAGICLIFFAFILLGFIHN
jgi:hypothetical protein